MKFLSLKHQGSYIIPYGVAWAFQKSLVEKRAKDQIEDTILFVEHSPTITRGRGLQWTGQSREREMPLAKIPPKTDYYEIERGGDLTWHGPGQLVIYPIVKLDGKGQFPHHDVTGFLRTLERVLIGVLKSYDLDAQMRENATGVWVQNSGTEKKIASIGIAVSKWVSYHGVAINAVNDPKSFDGFDPCGFDSQVMTSLEELGVRLGDDWRSELEVRIARQFLNQSVEESQSQSLLSVKAVIESFEV